MTICAVLNKNSKAIYSKIEDYDVEGSKNLVIEILENHFLSTLGTYMTCINV